MNLQSVTCCVLILMLAACSSSRTSTSTRPSANSSKGGYYLDDGPPKDKVDLAKVKDAVPRSEPLSATGNKTYVVFGKTYVPLKSNKGFRQKGTASWYGKKFHGKRTSSGEPYDMYKMTAAHTVLPIPSYAKVKNLENGRSVIVRVNDRGPFKHNRVMDLSYAAALKLDVVRSGTGRVEIISIGENTPARQKMSEASGEAQAFIQLGAYSNQDTAYRLQQRLQSDGYTDVAVNRIEQRGLNLYRVRLGPLEKAGDVDFMLADLHHAGYNDAHIIIETTR
ncbi:MAG: septal ring lytic transglycosylase RlpA family protein [Arenicellales bacterium]